MGVSKQWKTLTSLVLVAATTSVPSMDVSMKMNRQKVMLEIQQSKKKKKKKKKGEKKKSWTLVVDLLFARMKMWLST